MAFGLADLQTYCKTGEILHPVQFRTGPPPPGDRIDSMPVFSGDIFPLFCDGSE
jgi:hypothetical protein